MLIKLIKSILFGILAVLFSFPFVYKTIIQNSGWHHFDAYTILCLMGFLIGCSFTAISFAYIILIITGNSGVQYSTHDEILRIRTNIESMWRDK